MKRKQPCMVSFLIIVAMTMMVLVACTDKGSQAIEENTFRISFVSNGGGAVEAIEGKAGERISEPAVPEKAGFVFEGWYESLDGGSTFEENPFVFNYMPARSFTLYAKWSEQVVSYTITFESNGGSAVKAIEGKAGDRIEAPVAPVRNGYIFDGWHESTDGGATLEEEPFVFSYMPSHSMTLYAKWILESVAGKVYQQDDTYFAWKNEAEKALFAANGMSSEEYIATYEKMKIKLVFANDEQVSVSFYDNKNDLCTHSPFYAIGEDNTLRFYKDEGKKVKYTGVGILNQTFRLSNDRSNVMVVVAVNIYDKNNSEKKLATADLILSCPVAAGN